jgi:hypothetical protein
MTTNPVPSDTDRLAEALDCVEQGLTAPWEPAFIFGTTASEALQQVRAEVQQLQGRLDTAEGHADDLRAALERRLLQVRSLRSGGPKKVNPLVCTTPVTTVEDEIEDARVWWEGFDRESVVQTFGLRETPARALGLGEGDGQ